MVFVRADTAEGQSIRARAHRIAYDIAQNIANRKGLKMEIHEITPGYLERTSVTLPPGMSITIDDSCALVFCGFYNNETTGDVGVLRIQRGNEFLADLNLLPIAMFAEDKRGVDAGFEKWGVWKEGEDLSLGFRDPVPTADVKVFPVGYVIVPEGKVDIVR
jgi:hypothetical protein